VTWTPLSRSKGRVGHNVAAPGRTACMAVFWYIHMEFFPSVLWHCWLGNRKGMWPVKSWVLVCCWWQFDWSFAHLVAPVVNTILIIHSSDQIQNGDIVVPANLGPSGKMAVKMERFSYRIDIYQEWEWLMTMLVLSALSRSSLGLPLLYLVIDVDWWCTFLVFWSYCC